MNAANSTKALPPAMKAIEMTGIFRPDEFEGGDRVGEVVRLVLDSVVLADMTEVEVKVGVSVIVTKVEVEVETEEEKVVRGLNNERF